MKKESITCDGCDKEMIVDTHYPARYGLKLSAEDYNRNSSSTVFCVAVHPPIDRDHHFCGKKCLVDWASKA